MALHNGHEVTGFVRKKREYNESRANLTFAEGDATDPAAVAQAMPGHDAIISALGHNRHTAVEMQPNAMRTITAAMKRHSITRIVSLTGAGVFTAGDSPTIIDRAAMALFLFLDSKKALDGIKHVEVLKDSGLDWVVVRTPKHRGGKKITDYQIRPTIKGVSFSVSRVNVVDALLKQATAENIPHRLPVIND